MLITNKDLNKTKNSSITEDDEINWFELYYYKIVYIMILID